MSASTSADTYTKMRKIKFRAYDKNKRRWILNYAHIGENGKMYIAFDTPDMDLVVMQFTGLKDNTKWEQLTSEEQKEWIDSGRLKEEWNGKEIYEGDVIKISFSAYVPNTDHIVKWDEGFCRFTGEVIEKNKHSEYHQDRLYIFHPSTNCEVIGNIHENPELLVPKPTE